MLITFCIAPINTDMLISIAITNFCKINNYPEFDYKIVRNIGGKPSLSPNLLQISVSHSNKIVVVAVSQQNIGIDIEYNKKLINIEKISTRFFDKPINSSKEFFDHFTLSEATTKLTQIPLPKTMKFAEFDGKIMPFFIDFTLAIAGEDTEIAFIEYYKK